MNQKLYIALCFILKLVPLNRGVFFSSFNDMYNDNPRYISEMLHTLSPSTSIIWSVSDRTEKGAIPAYVKCVRIGTVKHAYYKMCSKVIIDNYVGNFFYLGNKKTTKLLGWLKRKNQYNYSTWHGTPLKCIGKDIGRENELNFISTTNGFILNSIYEKNIFQKAFGEQIPVFLLGSARNDPLFIKDKDYLNSLKEKLGLKKNTRYVLYAPTFRKGMNGSVVGTIIIQADDVKRCINAFEERFGGEWAFIYRVHQNYMCSLSEYFSSGEGDIVDGNLHNDMAEYLACCNALITDYSGSLFDVALTTKPCFLYTPDLTEYQNERGLYMQLKELPFSCSESIETLINAVRNYDERCATQKKVEFNSKLGVVDDGCSSERIARLIIERINFNAQNCRED